MGEDCLARVPRLPYTAQHSPFTFAGAALVNRPPDPDAARRRTRCQTAASATFAFASAAQRQWLTPRGCTLLQQAVGDGHGLDADLAHEVARALRGWAASRGATEVAFRVHPLTGEPAEYRMALSALTGEDLCGGIRSTAPAVRGDAPWRADVTGGAARAAGPGRLTWDPASLPYIRVGAGEAVLCLPSVLASEAGEALDHRLPLMRSEDAVAVAARRALRLLGAVPGPRVRATVALTRAFTLSDNGSPSPRATPDRAAACVIAAERELDRIGAGVRIGGEELTVLPSSAGVAGDRLAVALEVLRDVAARYGLTLHERGAGPDAWSLMAGTHTNLLAPGNGPRAHLRFAFFAAAVVRAFATYPGLVGDLDLGPDLDGLLASLSRGALFAGSEDEVAAGAPRLARIAGRDTAYGFTGAGFALGELHPFTATVVNTIVAAALNEQTRALEDWLAAGEDLEPAVREVIADAFRRHCHAVATRDAAPDPAALRSDATVRLFAEQSVLSARELAARDAVRLHAEALAAMERARAYVAPAAILRRARLSPPRGPEAGRRAAEIDDALRTVQAASRALDAVVAGAVRAEDLCADVPPLLDDLRAAARRLTA